MSVRINSFGGPLTWVLRKHCSAFTSMIMFSFVSRKRANLTETFIDWFFRQDEPPLFQNVMIETVNRCNGKCEFCPANVKDEARLLKKMPDEVFYGIIAQLKDLDWKGKLFMCVNNEPFIDKRILDFSRHAKKELPDIEIAMITNGTLLTNEMMDEMIGIVDQITINDYSEHYRLSAIHKKIYKHVKSNDKFSSMKIVINRRYSKEILATRAGSAPNKPRKNVDVNIPCLFPFTDMIVFPDGKVGMCCNDCYEVTDFGNVTEQGLKAIWSGIKFRTIRESMIGGRKHPFCSECDVLDAGERENEIRTRMKAENIYEHN